MEIPSREILSREEFEGGLKVAHAHRIEATIEALAEWVGNWHQETDGRWVLEHEDAGSDVPSLEILRDKGWLS